MDLGFDVARADRERRRGERLRLRSESSSEYLRLWRDDLLRSCLSDLVRFLSLRRRRSRSLSDESDELDGERRRLLRFLDER